MEKTRRIWALYHNMEDVLGPMGVCFLRKEDAEKRRDFLNEFYGTDGFYIEEATLVQRLK